MCTDDKRRQPQTDQERPRDTAPANPFAIQSNYSDTLDDGHQTRMWQFLGRAAQLAPTVYPKLNHVEVGVFTTLIVGLPTKLERQRKSEYCYKGAKIERCQ